MKRYREHGWWEIPLVIAVIALAIGVIVFLCVADSDQRTQCEERGGQVIRIHGSRDGGWFCQESTK